MAVAVADALEACGLVRDDHPIWSQLGMDLLYLAQPETNMRLWRTGKGSIPWLYAIQEYSAFRTMYEELNDFMDALFCHSLLQPRHFTDEYSLDASRRKAARHIMYELQRQARVRGTT